jgi:hypothetical protein
MLELGPPDIQIISAESSQARLDTPHLAGGISAGLMPHAKLTVISSHIHFITSSFQRCSISQCFSPVRYVQKVDSVVDASGNNLGPILSHFSRQFIIRKLVPEMLMLFFGIIKMRTEDNLRDYEVRFT